MGHHAQDPESSVTIIPLTAPRHESQCLQVWVFSGAKFDRTMHITHLGTGCLRTVPTKTNTKRPPAPCLPRANRCRGFSSARSLKSDIPLVTLLRRSADASEDCPQRGIRRPYNRVPGHRKKDQSDKYCTAENASHKWASNTSHPEVRRQRENRRQNSCCRNQ